MAYQGRVDPAGKRGKGFSRGSAYSCVQVHKRGGGERFERPGSGGRTRRTRRSATRP